MKDIPTPQEAEDVPKNRLDAWIIKASQALSMLFILTVFISFYEVLMRYVFDAPTTWVHETASFVGGSLFVIGGIYAFATDKHVRVVLIYDAVSKQTRRALNMVHHIVGLTFSLMMAWASYTMTKTAWYTPWGEFRLETSGSYFNPPYPALLKALIFVIFCILSLQFILHIIHEIKSLRSGKDV